MASTAKVWALSDMHLPGDKNKTMDRFGSIWLAHPSQIRDNVTATCGENDILLVSGDVTWASNIEGARADLQFIAQLGCRVVLSEGNHDSWASSYNAVMRNLPPNVFWAKRGCTRIGNVAIVSTRLCDFDCVEWPDYIKTECSDPQKQQRRDFMRLENALKELPQGDDIIRILMVHYPPISANGEANKLTDIINKYNVDYCVYGHLHYILEKQIAMDVKIGKTRFMLTASDHLKMKPVEICDFKVGE